MENGRAEVTYRAMGAAIVLPIPIPFTIRYIGMMDIWADTIIPARKKIWKKGPNFPLNLAMA